MKIRVAILVAGSLVGCTNQSSESTDTKARIAVCEDVMRKYIVEAKIYERDRQRLVASCNISQKERTLEQWQCVLAGMETGAKYAEMSERCGTVGKKQ